MFGRKSPAVLVAGAGPVGLFAALCLARDGIDVEIIDEAEEVDETGSHVPPDDVVILSPGSLALLDRAQLATELLRGCQQVSSLGLYDEERDEERDDEEYDAGPSHRSQQRRCVAEISFARWAAELGLGFPFVAVAARTALESALRAALQRQHVKVRSGWRLALMEQGAARTRVLLERLGRESTGYATLHTELVVEKSEELEPSFVIATEGRTVPVYRQLGIELKDLGRRTTYAVFDGKRPALALGSERARLVHGSQADAAFWPRKDDGLHCVVALGELGLGKLEEAFAPEAEPINAEAEEVVGSRVALEKLTALLAERAPRLARRTSGLEPRSLFSAQPRLASEFGRGRIWLAGAAAHSAAPLAAQSSNGGLREAARLAELFAGALNRGERLDALEDYNRQCTRQWELLLDPPLSGRNIAPVRAAFGRLSAGLAASSAEQEALLAQL